MRQKLSPAFVARAVAEPGKERSIFWDAELAGFGLQVTKAGHKSFVCQYRNAEARSRRTAIKATLTLSEARKEAKSIIGKVAKGGDPLDEKRKATGAAENTLQAVGENYFRREGRKLRKAQEIERLLKRLVYPRLGLRQIDDIKRSEIISLLDKVADENGEVQADRVLAHVRRIMSWHAGRSEFKSPIVRGMARCKPSELKRERTLTDDELRAIWKAAGEINGAFGPLVKFLLLTAARRNEAARMERSELSYLQRDEFEGDVWTIPASRNKTKLEDVKPLSRGALDVLAGLPVIQGCDFLFTNDARGAFGGFGRYKRKLDKASGVTDWRLHDLRRTARTLLSRAGVNSDISERCLGHVIGGVRGVYDRHQYIAEKRAAFEALAAQIERILDPQENVVPLRGKA
jgi:integrase